jgi:hypothetical protein
MSLIEPPKIVKMVQSLGECKIKETLILGALSWDHTKRTQKSRKHKMLECETVSSV